MGGELWGEWKHAYSCMAEPLLCPPETVRTLLTGYTPKENKVKKKSNSSVGQAGETLSSLSAIWDHQIGHFWRTNEVHLENPL